MAPPHLPDLLIEGYRGLRRLELKKLGNVNLIVGRNGVGKTSVLEAVRLYASVAAAEGLADLLRLRREGDANDDRFPQFELSAVSSLFFGSPDARRTPVEMTIGPRARPMQLSIVWVPSKLDSLGNRILYFDASADWSYSEGDEAALLVRKDDIVQRLLTLKRVPVVGTPFDKPMNAVELRPSVFVTSNGIDDDSFSTYWDEVLMADREQVIEALVQSVWPDVLGIRLYGTQRRPKVRVRGAAELVPLSRLGEGIVRFLGIAIALVKSQNGFLLIDEFENGLHYAPQEALWKFLIRAARDLNVQVFATTHSRDCIGAFGRATAEDAQSDGVLTRLVQSGDGVIAKQLEEEDILLATENLVEIR